MHATPDAARLSAAVARFCEDTRRAAERIVATAYGARQLGAKAETYRRRALDLLYSGKPSLFGYLLNPGR